MCSKNIKILSDFGLPLGTSPRASRAQFLGLRGSGVSQAFQHPTPHCCFLSPDRCGCSTEQRVKTRVSVKGKRGYWLRMVDQIFGPLYPQFSYL